MPRRTIAMTGAALAMLGAYSLVFGGAALPADAPVVTGDAATLPVTPERWGAVPEWLGVSTLLGGFGLVALAAWWRRRDG